MFQAFISIKNLEYQKRMRLDKRIEYILLSGNAYWFTLTFTDEYLEICSIETLTRYAKEWSRKYLSIYLGNQDYGSLNGRFHIHVLGVPKIKFVRSWIYGNMDFVKTYNQHFKKIRNYIIKFNRHANKDTACKIFRSKEIKI